jgi:putative transcriptional regulator
LNTDRPYAFTPAEQKMVITLLFWIFITILQTAPALAGTELAQTPIAKGALLVAHPSMEDPNFRHTVVLIVEHGPEGTLGFVLNRPTDIPLSQALPDLAALKGTDYHLFIGGPVAPNRMTMLVRMTEPFIDMRPVFDGVYMGGTPAILERLITQPEPTEAFRVFAGMAGWAPGQLAFEIGQGAWATLPPDATGIFDNPPATLCAASKPPESFPTSPSLTHATLPDASGREHAPLISQRAVKNPLFNSLGQDSTAPLSDSENSRRHHMRMFLSP